METNLRNIDFLEAKSLKQITDLYYINIKIEREKNKPLVDRIYKENSVIFSLNAIVWKKSNFINYKKVSSKLILFYPELKNYSFKEIKERLIKDIYIQVIKNKIMML